MILPNMPLAGQFPISRLLIALLGFLLCCGFGSIAYGTQRGETSNTELDLQDIRDGLALREQQTAYATVRITVRMEDMYPDGRRESWDPGYDNWRIWRSGGRFRVYQELTKGNKVPLIHEFAWNERQFTTLLTPAKVAPGQRPRGSITAEPSAGPCTAFYYLVPLEQRIFDMEDSLFTIVRKGEWRAIGAERIAGRSAWHIQGSKIPGRMESVAHVIDIWIDPTHGFAPLRIRQSMKIGERAFACTMQDVELGHENGVWVINKATNVVTNAELGHGRGEQRAYFTLAYEQLGVEPAQTFDIPFPQGTLVWNDVSKTSSEAGVGEYILAPDGQHMQLASTVDGADIPVAAPTTTAQASAWRWPLRVLLVLGVLALALYFRRKTTKAT